MTASTVSRQVTFQVLDAEIDYAPVPSVWCYDADDPYAVEVVFPGEPASWVMARDLIAVGLRQAAGYGDIRLWPMRGRQRLCMNLSSPDGWVLLSAAADSAREFLRATYRIVPAGRESEHVDLSVLNRLLDGAA